MKPQDFLLGVRDLFAVFAPGAILLFLFGKAPASAAGAGDLLVFAVFAFVAGSVATAIGAALDHPADGFVQRGFARRERIAQAKRHEYLANAFRDEVAAKAAGIPISREVVESLGKAKGFWWDQLRLLCPVAAAELDRLEAVQKLFRSLLAVFLIALIGDGIEAGLGLLSRLGIQRGPDIESGWCVFGMVLSAAFYVYHRWRFNIAVYRFTLSFAIAPWTEKTIEQGLTESWKRAMDSNFGLTVPGRD
jgi:hypothetical protein